MAPVLQSSQQWVEKYRPKQVKDVAHQEEVVRVLTNTLETSNCPHMLFYGPPGTGKTTTALAIAHQLFGPELYKSRVLELNASDDRGINVVRTKIKDFAAVAVGSGQRQGCVIPQEIVKAFLVTCKSGNFDVANKEVNDIIAEGYPVSQMLYQLLELVVEADDVSDEQKARICKKLAEADKCLVDGADEYLQLLDVASNTMRALCNMPQEFSYEC
ncbi:hypothetical protein F2P56_033842 [Juglans regia]|uniref:AAA+ ATPase domain-containing protein n=1 Tax=Juglans regia TaxID=51240 RepID=A0A833U0S7_JUGRE|nr:hypothetical protein F2P56_033842 [Juglans regia]